MKNMPRHALWFLPLALLAGCNVEGPSNEEQGTWVADTLSGYTFMTPPDVVMADEFTGIDSWSWLYTGDSVSFSVEGGFVMGPDRSPERPEYEERSLPLDTGMALLITARSDTTAEATYFVGLYLYSVDSSDIEWWHGPHLVFSARPVTATERDIAVRLFEGVKPLE